MKNVISSFFNKPFIRNVVILASGTAISQIINMIFTPIITRLYGPEAYGLMGTFTAIISTIGPLAALSYPIAIVLPKDDKDSKDIIKLSLITVLINTLILSILLMFIQDYIVELFNLEKVSRFLLYVPFVFLSTGVLQTIHQWLIRKNGFRITAKSNLIETIIINTGKLVIGIKYPFASVLILLTALRSGIRAFLMTFYSGYLNYKDLISMISVKKHEIILLAKKYKDFPLYRTPEVVISSLSNNTPIFLLTTFFGPAAVGFYTVARSVLGIPSTLIAQSVGDVFYPKVANAAQNREKVTPLIIQSTFYLSLVALIPYGFIILFGPWLFGLVFGQDWIIAGEYARWVSVWSFFTFINRPSVQSLPVISAQKFQLVFTISKLFITSIALFLGYYLFNSDIVAIILYSISGGVSYLVLILITIIKSKKFDEINSIN